MRVVLVSTHVDQTTGYSKVAFNLLRQLGTLSPKVKTYHFGFQRRPNKPNLRKVPTNIVSYDAAANEDPPEEGFGFNKIYEYLEMVSPDLVLIYNDPLIIARFIDAMKFKKGETPYKLWLYLDQVYTDIAPPLMDKIRESADKIYCFTEKWAETLRSYGVCPPIGIMEHAVDPTVFTSMPVDARLAIRKKMNIPEHAVVLFNANRNDSRKRIDLTVAGFVDAIRTEEAPLYLVLAMPLDPRAGAHYDVGRIFMSELARYKLDPMKYGMRLITLDTAGQNSINDDGINQLYNISDLGINTTSAEGFGLCQLEHMYTGAPQIVTDVGSFRTFLTEEVAAFIPVQEDRAYLAAGMPLGFYTNLVLIKDITIAIQESVKTLETRREAIQKYPFKSWATVCDGFLEDILNLAG